ncbi:phosphopantetheine-binding protein [Psychrobacillus sp. PGGUH221]|uniref:acyl carrier protein n=1 Tax=Psychrobacillus sp. PGGUH221 TaxID=3020058 RepID=UPI0035C6F803
MKIAFEIVAKHISEIAHVPIDNIKKESKFQDDLGIDSLKLVNLFIQLAEVTGVEFNRFLLAEDLKTVGGIYFAITKGEDNDNN